MDRKTLDRLTRLSQLQLSAEEERLVLDDLGHIVALIDEMQAVDTEGVEPLAHPLDMDQPLRDDAVTEAVDRARFLAVAPLTRDGLYLVPRVVE